MTSKAVFYALWERKTAQERRARLNELGAKGPQSDDEQREHDTLAAMVAEDEDNG